MRRTPAATPPSLTILNRPMSPVRATCVPPHSSVENRRCAARARRRRTSRRTAPSRRRRPPSSYVISRVSAACVVRGSRRSPAARSARSSSGVIGWKCEKSKRRRSGATSEPFCCTCAPSTLRSAACSRCVAEWLGMMALRRAASTFAASLSPTLMLPLRRACRCARCAAPRFCVSSTCELRADVAELAGVADLAAGLGIERRAVEHHLAFVAGVERLHRRAVLEQRDDLCRHRVVAS